MRIRITKSLAGRVMRRRGEVLEVGSEIDKKEALSLLNSGLAIAESGRAETAEFPVHTGGGWYRLSNGEKRQGKEAAQAAEREL